MCDDFISFVLLRVVVLETSSYLCAVVVFVVAVVGLGTGNARSQCGGDVSDAQKCLFSWRTHSVRCV